jgi:hypothetical protein
MLEPVLPFLATELQMGPARIGLVFGIAAVARQSCTGVRTTRGPLGGRRLMLIGLFAIGSVLPFLRFSRGFDRLWRSTSRRPSCRLSSLAFMAKAISAAGIQSFGVAYGIQFSALGLPAGPAAGGFLYERMGFERLTTKARPSS